MTNLTIILCCAFFESVIFVALLKRYVPNFGLVSKRNFRRLEPSQIPLLGGLGIYISFLSSSLFFLSSPSTLRFFVMSLPILIVGIADDIYELSPRTKVTSQLLAIVIWCLNETPTLLIDTGVSSPLAYIFSAFWILGVMNATNMIDGIDGIASSFAILGFAAAGFLPGQIDSTGLWIMSACYCGFFVFNFAPAKIYLGDLGSQLIGLYLATELMCWRPTIPSKYNLLVPLMIFAFPQIDAMLAIYRRLMAGQSPFHADKEHLHHKVLHSLESVRLSWVFISIIIAINAVTALIISADTETFIKFEVLISSVTLLTTLLWWTIKTEKVMTSRIAQYGNVIIQKKFEIAQELEITSSLKSIVVYDLKPYYEGLLVRGLGAIDNFIESFSLLIKKQHPKSEVFLIGDYSILIMRKYFADSVEFKAEVNLQFLGLTKKYNIQKNDSASPRGLSFLSLTELEQLAKKNKILVIKRDEKLSSQKMAG